MSMASHSVSHLLITHIFLFLTSGQALFAQHIVMYTSLSNYSLQWISMNDMLRLVNSSEVRIEGLETLDYLDNLSHKERFTEQGDAITFESEVKNFPVLNELMYIYYLNMLKLAWDLHLGKSCIFIGIAIHITIFFSENLHTYNYMLASMDSYEDFGL